MKVTTQDGEIVEVEEVNMHGYVISGKLSGVKNQYMALGHYYDKLRVCEVFAELTCTGWNDKKSEYVMPKN